MAAGTATPGSERWFSSTQRGTQRAVELPHVVAGQDTRRRLIALLDGRLVRRLTIAPAVVIAAVVGFALSPIILLVLYGADKIGGQPRSRRVRLVALVIGALVIEVLGMIVAFASWIVAGFGFLGTARWRWHLQRRYMGLYTRVMLGWIARVLGTTIEWRDQATLDQGPVVVVARHTSFFDALIPATLLSNRNGLLAHHILTQGLRYGPCLDIVGHRFPNRFIRRTPGEGSSELAHISEIGALLDHRSAAVIFPEGTFRNPHRFERVVRRLRRRDPELAQRAQSLRHVLPPRANGTHALLDGAPDADVVVCTNTGLEGFGSIREIVERPFSDVPIIVETWRIDRAEVPMADSDTFNEWLFATYEAIDTWVEENGSGHVGAKR